MTYSAEITLTFSVRMCVLLYLVSALNMGISLNTLYFQVHCFMFWYIIALCKVIVVHFITVASVYGIESPNTSESYMLNQVNKYTLSVLLFQGSGIIGAQLHGSATVCVRD